MAKHKKDNPETDTNRDDTALEEEQAKDTAQAKTRPEPELSPEEQARAEAQQWKDKYLRQLAEFDNFRKRMRQEIDQLSQSARESLIVSVLPVKDDFDRMFASEFTADENFRKGIELIYNKLNNFLDSLSVKKMDGRGSMFDPEKHDALMMQPTADFPPGTILEVVTPGYMMGGRVIRHAQVMVSAEPEDASADDSDADSGDSDSDNGSEA